MVPFAIPVLGRGWLPATPPGVFTHLVRHIGVVDQASVTDAEPFAHLMLLRRNDNGAAMLQIMRRFETIADAVAE